mmetsp:Transcript_6978/g.6134  ORF Transcript_6978/g.6134 Transcript_6978/m.6134 type:complete len:97 (-) Transcript_6978:552-842(-)|eukprot:CAMPEP_0170547412 /NCGR_PEP_ID=MMETSP0211-20121228/5812_1 /TAXON_ID=311385 /ORGANISM="Pseudokeronopsis sp., Strain OXSARD2" /LENGTH=96 /DNA_ID=CAMNT_0010852449 /DNA_START=1084 /DNA_END=1374 /DNA_ORIENTATION=-
MNEMSKQIYDLLEKQDKEHAYINGQMQITLTQNILENSQKLFADNMQDLIQKLTAQFADKFETKKQLKILEKQLKNLYDLLQSKNQQLGTGATFDE